MLEIPNVNAPFKGTLMTGRSQCAELVISDVWLARRRQQHAQVAWHQQIGSLKWTNATVSAGILTMELKIVRSVVTSV